MKSKLVLFIVVAVIFQPIIGQDSLMTILSKEMEREMKELSQQENPPYYIDYRVDDIKSLGLHASFGSLIQENEDRARVITVNVKVGDYNFDNTHEFKGEFSQPYQNALGTVRIPLEDNPEAISQIIWRAVDQNYKNASSNFTALKNRKNRYNEQDVILDFSKEYPVEYFEPVYPDETFKIDKDDWIKRLKEYTTLFQGDSTIFHCEAALSFVYDRKYFLSTENSHIIQNSIYCQVQFMVSIRHNKGTLLPLNKSYTAFHPADLPKHEVIIQDIKNLYQTLKKLQTSELAEPYAGPAILSPEASGVFFHEIFGHRIEGHRLENISDGQTFKDKLNTKVLPKGFNVISDPTLQQFNDQDLIGYYKYDDQGIEGKKVQVVEDGILKHFLMSRRPTKEFSSSTGHGRAQAGFLPVSRQSNLIIESANPLSDEDLRKMLIKACKKQDKEFGYYFKSVVGGLTITDRYNTNVFNITPTKVYKIYVDGRPDELVSGVELIGTPLTMFSNIEAAGNVKKVFTGFCGAESGHIPVTAISPALFVRKIETQKSPEYDSKIPLLNEPEYE